MNKEVLNSRSTTQSNLLHWERCNLNVVNRLPLFALPVIWNQWSTLFPEINSMTNFKRCLKMKMINNYLDKVRCNYNRCIASKTCIITIKWKCIMYKYFILTPVLNCLSYFTFSPSYQLMNLLHFDPLWTGHPGGGGALSIYTGGGVPRHIDKGGVSHGHKPKKGVLGTVTTPPPKKRGGGGY